MVGDSRLLFTIMLFTFYILTSFGEMEVLCLLYYPLICCCCKFFLLVVIVILDLKYNLKSLPLGGEGGGLLSSDNVRSTSPVSDFLSDNVRSTSHTDLRSLMSHSE